MPSSSRRVHLCRFVVRFFYTLCIWLFPETYVPHLLKPFEFKEPSVFAIYPKGQMIYTLNPAYEAGYEIAYLVIIYMITRAKK